MNTWHDSDGIPDVVDDILVRSNFMTFESVEPLMRISELFDALHLISRDITHV